MENIIGTPFLFSLKVLLVTFSLIFGISSAYAIHYGGGCAYSAGFTGMDVGCNLYATGEKTVKFIGWQRGTVHFPMVGAFEIFECQIDPKNLPTDYDLKFGLYVLPLTTTLVINDPRNPARKWECWGYLTPTIFGEYHGEGRFSFP